MSGLFDAIRAFVEFHHSEKIPLDDFGGEMGDAEQGGFGLFERVKRGIDNALEGILEIEGQYFDGFDDFSNPERIHDDQTAEFVEAVNQLGERALLSGESDGGEPVTTLYDLESVINYVDTSPETVLMVDIKLIPDAGLEYNVYRFDTGGSRED